MKKIKPFLVKSLSVSCLLVATYANAAGPGYVSRDCPGGGAKESITLDWDEKDHWFQTYSMHAFPKSRSRNDGASWIRYRSDPKPGARGGWDETWHSYAGDNRNYAVNNFYSRVIGYHYWFNLSTLQIEQRTSDVRNCNLTSWGSGNWSDKYQVKANFPSFRQVFSVIVNYF